MRTKGCLLLILAFLISLIAFPPSSEAAVTKVACVGDSITFGNGASNTDLYSYPTQLQGLLGSNYEVRNYGVGNRTMLKKGDYPYWNESAYTNSSNWNPNVVIIMLGTNDSKSWNWKYKSEFLSNYVEMINHYKNLSSHPKVYVALSATVQGAGNFGITNAVVTGEIVPLTRQAAAQTSSTIIDNNAATLNLPQFFISDGIHPTDSGYNLLAYNIYNVLTYSPTKYYTIVNRSSGKLLSNNTSTTNGTSIVQATSNGTTSQQWKLADAGEGYFKLINRHSGKVLDVNGASTADGAKIIQWTDSGALNQQWEVLSLSAGYNRIVSRKSGKYLDIGTDNSQVVQKAYSGATIQQWSLVPVP